MGSLGYYKASIGYIDLLQGSYNGSYPPDNVLEYLQILSPKPQPLHPKAYVESAAILCLRLYTKQWPS